MLLEEENVLMPGFVSVLEDSGLPNVVGITLSVNRLLF